MILVRQDVPIPVKLTGNTTRWPMNCHGNSVICGVEVEPQAPLYKDRTIWVNADKLMWQDEEPVGLGELEGLVRRAADENDVICKILDELPDEAMSPVVRLVAGNIVEAARDIGTDPRGFTERIVAAGRLGDVCSGVSIWAVVNDLCKEHE